jgi:hypothetical protein
LLLVLARVVGVGLAHDEVKLVTRVAGARDPPLATVEDDFVGFLVVDDRETDVGGAVSGRGWEVEGRMRREKRRGETQKEESKG